MINAAILTNGNNNVSNRWSMSRCKINRIVNSLRKLTITTAKYMAWETIGLNNRNNCHRKKLSLFSSSRLTISVKSALK